VPRGCSGRLSVHPAELVVRAAPARGAHVDAIAGSADSADSPATRSDRHRTALVRWRAKESYGSCATAVGRLDACAVVDPAITARECAWVNGRVRVTGGVARVRLWRRGPFTCALTTDATRTVVSDGVVAYVGPGGA